MPGPKWTRKEFAQSIRDKHLATGAYSDWNDDELVDAYLEKHPVYRDQVESPLDQEVARMEALGVSTKPLTPSYAPPKPPAPPKPAAPTIYDSPKDLVGKIGRDILSGGEALIRGLSLGGIQAGVPDDNAPEERLAEMGGAMLPGVAATVFGGPGAGAAVMGAQGFGGSLGRSYQEEVGRRKLIEESEGTEQPPVGPGDVFTGQNVAKALGHGAAGYVTGRLPGAIGSTIPTRLGTGVAIGAATGPLPQVAEDLITKGSVDFNAPEFREQVELGATLGLVPGAASILSKGLQTLQKPGPSPLPDGWQTPKEPLVVNGDTVIAYQPVQGGWNIRLAGDPTTVIFKEKPKVRVGGEQPPPLVEPPPTPPPPTGGVVMPPEFAPVDAPVAPDLPPTQPSAAPDIVEQIRQKMAAGEPLGSLDRRKNFAERQRVEAERARIAAEQQAAMEPTGTDPLPPPIAQHAERVKMVMPEDTTDLTNILATSLYAKNRHVTAAKELLQNAVDEVALSGTPDKDIKVSVLQPATKGYGANAPLTITVSDRGRGPTPDQVKKLLLTISGSGKRGDPNASGGFGVASLSFISAADDVNMVSVARQPDGSLLQTTLSGPPDGLVLDSAPAPHGTPTGTSFTSKFIPREGEYMSTGDIEGIVEEITTGSKIPGGRIQVERQGIYDSQPRTAEHAFTDLNTWDLVSERESPALGGKVQIYRRPGSQDKIQKGTHAPILNIGIGTAVKSSAGGWGSPDLPLPSSKDLRVNYIPSMKEGDLKNPYPFTANRESIRDNYAQAIDSYFKEVVYQPAFERYKQARAGLLADAAPIAAGQFGPIRLMDPGGRLTPQESERLRTLPQVRHLAKTLDKILRDVWNHGRALIPKEFNDAIKGTGLLFGDSKEGTGSTYGVYIPESDTEAYVFFNPFAAIKKSIENQEKLRAAGLGDPQDTTASLAASHAYHTIIHEAIHNAVKDHDTTYAYTLADVYSGLSPTIQRKALATLKHAFADPTDATGTRLHPEIAEALQLYLEVTGRSDTRPNLLSGEFLGEPVKPGGAGDVPPGAASGDQGPRGGLAARFLEGEEGSIRPEVATQIAAPAVGGVLGWAGAGEDETLANKASAAFVGALAGAGVAYGIKHSKLIPSRQARLEMDQLKRMAVGHAEAALRPMHPQLKKLIRPMLKDAWTGAEAIFRPFHRMMETGPTYGSPDYFRPVVEAFADFYTRQFQHPVTALRQIQSVLDPVIGSYRDARQAFQILRLQRDIGTFKIDNDRRAEAFATLQQYRQAKAAGATPAQLSVIRGRNARVRKYRGLSPTRPVREQMTFQDAGATLNNLVMDAQASRPQVLQAVQNVRQLLTNLGNELVAEGLLSPLTIAENQHYFPDYVLDYLTKPTTVGGGSGIRPHKLGALHMRGPRDPDMALWNDLGGPLMKRLLDQRVMLDNYKTVNGIVQQYDITQQIQGTTGQIPKGYTTYHFKDRTTPNAPQVQGIIPAPLAAELSSRFHSPELVERMAREVRRVGAGAMIRFAGLPFLVRNWASDSVNLYAKTKLGDWHRLPPQQLKGIASALLLEAYDDLAQVPQWGKGLYQTAKTAEQSGVGIAAAAAEVTDAALQDPKLRSMARDPNAPIADRVGNAIVDPIRGAANAFDRTRAVQEASNRVAMFMDLVRQAHPQPQPAQLLRIGANVNDALGNYSRSNYANWENRWLRQAGIMFFYAWQKIAGQNWIPFAAREVVSEGVRHTGRKASAAAIGRQYARVAIPFMALPVIFNHTMFPEVEASLTDREKDNPHLIVPDLFDPWDEENRRWNVRLITLPGPVNNVARMVGLGGAPNRAIHFAKGTGRQTFNDELEYTADQMAEFWLGLLGAPIAAGYGLASGKDMVTGIRLDKEEDPVWRRAVDRAVGVTSALPPFRQMMLAAREGRTGPEDIRAFLERSLTGGVYKEVDRDRAMDRKVRAAIAMGHEAGDEVMADAKERRDELPPEIAAILTEDEIKGFSKEARKDWMTKAAELLKLRDRAGNAADAAPEHPEALDRAFTVRPTREGFAPIPTTARLRALGPEAALAEFISMVGAGGLDSWRAQMSAIASQLRREDAAWETTSAIMMMLQQEPSAYADVEIDKRMQGLIKARTSQAGEGSWIPDFE